ncbi:MAG TPA: zf-HC2 domain-containing protein [Gaiellaceae bacterium]
MGAVRSAECERARLQASLRLDAELSEIEEASLRAHVGWCAACAGFERELVALTWTLRTAPLRRPAAGVTLPRRRSATARVLQISAAAAAVMLAAGLGSLAGSLSTRTTTLVATAETVGTDSGGMLDRGNIALALAYGDQLLASRIRPSVAL